MPRSVPTATRCHIVGPRYANMSRLVASKTLDGLAAGLLLYREEAPTATAFSRGRATLFEPYMILFMTQALS